MVEEKEEAPDLTADLEKARKEIKNLRRALAELSQEAEADKARADHELKSLRMEHRELADLRSLVFNINTADPARVEKTTRQISYPYSTRKRTVVFGGHDIIAEDGRLIFSSNFEIDGAPAISVEIFEKAE